MDGYGLGLDHRRLLVRVVKATDEPLCAEAIAQLTRLTAMGYKLLTLEEVDCPALRLAILDMLWEPVGWLN